MFKGIPHKIWRQVFLYTIPTVAITMNSPFTEMNTRSFLLGAAASVLAKSIPDGLLRLYISNVLFLTYSLLRMYPTKFNIDCYVFFIAYGFITNSTTKTEFLSTINLRPEIFNIELIAVFLGACTPNSTIDIVNVVLCLCCLYSTFTADRVCSEQNAYGKRDLYEVLKSKIDDEKLRAKEFKNITTQKTKKDDGSFDLKEYTKNMASNTCFFFLFYLITQNKMIYLFFALMNIVFELEIRHISFIITCLIILDVPWELMMVFYKCNRNRDITGQLLIGSLLYLITTTIGHASINSK